MNETNARVEGLAVHKESHFCCSIKNKPADGSDSSVGRQPNNKEILNHRELSDEELIRSFVESHDEEAFNEIVGRYGDRIYRLALRITHNPTDAEDVLQEVFITLVEKLGTFQGESKFSTWLYRVASNASFIHLRGETKYRNDVSLDDFAPYEEDGVLRGIEAKDWSGRPDEMLFSKEVLAIIEKAVDELPVTYGTVFHLRDVEGLANNEVAKILGLSVPNVKSKIHRARLFLRDRLSDYVPANEGYNSYPFT
jgi:RNA polymerase sigma-70 factor (ECF subfamily)